MPPGGRHTLHANGLLGITWPSRYGGRDRSKLHHVDYAAVAERSPGIVASAESADIGLLVVTRHSPFSAEIHLMAVRPEWHRHGIGRRLVERAEHALALDGVEYLQVKTLSDSHPDAGYAKTRAFYDACGFRVLEEFPTLWGPANAALQMIRAIRPAPTATIMASPSE